MLYNETTVSDLDVKYHRQYVATNDLGVVSLDWVETENTKGNPLKYENLEKDEKLLVIMHGLTGGSDTNYIKEIVNTFKNIEKMKVVVINYRGVSGNPLLTPFSYHIGYYTDLITAMDFIREKYPNLRCYALGTSMGANLFSKLLANYHDFDNYIKGFLSISNPLDIAEINKRNSWGILNYFLLKYQKEFLYKNKNILSEYFDYEKIKSFKRYKHFDEFFTCKLFGFDSVEEYYKDSSSFKDICKIKIPSIFFNAEDDRLSPVDCIDKSPCKFFIFLFPLYFHMSI
jgi:predicted alpha/beta-fold hydrolase